MRSIDRLTAGSLLVLILSLIVPSGPACGQTADSAKYSIHDLKRPQPPVVTPGAISLPVPPPSDAIVLFDGRDLSKWQGSGGKAAGWKVENGYMEVRPKSGSIETRQAFGDIQLHVEWAAPAKVEGHGQDRGNSGIFLMQRYEVQVLDSYDNPTYPDGQAAALYGQFPPLVNACKPPGEWQSFDIIFRRPHFDEAGVVVRPARLTLFHNGVLVQDNVALPGPVGHKKRPPYMYHPDKLPLQLQDHTNPVRFRNIWLRELPEK